MEIVYAMRFRKWLNVVEWPILHWYHHHWYFAKKLFSKSRFVYHPLVKKKKVQNGQLKREYSTFSTRTICVNNMIQIRISIFLPIFWYAACCLLNFRSRANKFHSVFWYLLMIGSCLALSNRFCYFFFLLTVSLFIANHSEIYGLIFIYITNMRP